MFKKLKEKQIQLLKTKKRNWHGFKKRFRKT